MPIQKVIESRYPVKVWTSDVDEKSIEQLKNVASMPFIHKHVAAMPDVHYGKGATIGSVIATKGAIIPAAVGVDLGCGMMAARTTLSAEMLPDNLSKLRSLIEQNVPHGRTKNGGKGDVGGWKENDIPELVSVLWNDMCYGYQSIISKHPKAKGFNTVNHLGTLGTGNHFIEICLDENNDVWVILHTGSRGPGNRIGSYFIEKAKLEMERYHISEYLPDKDLSYLVEYTDIFDDYVNAVHWCQDFALINRTTIFSFVIACMQKMFGHFDINAEAINCHHNYVDIENHFGSNVLVTRKGAIRAREGDLGIIPGSMGAKSFIVRGKGNKESFCSCSHGAGRKLGRNEAKRMFTSSDLADQTKGIECPKDDSRVDEIPAAYKDIDQVMANQSDLVEVVHTLKQIVNIKG